MEAVKKPVEKEGTERFRIRLASRDAKAIEKAVTDLLTRSVDKKVTVRGPIRLPTRTLRHTTRKSPCGNGTNTWDTYEMKIYKRVIDLHCNKETAKEITNIELPTGVDVAVTI